MKRLIRRISHLSSPFHGKATIMLLALLIVGKLSASPIKAPLATLFDHDKHMHVLQSQGHTCLSCHLMTKNPDGRMQVPRMQDPSKENNSQSLDFLDSVSRNSQTLQLQSCHSCHVEKTTSQAAMRCQTCHESVPAPRSHLSGFFERNHVMEAKINGNSCKTCHTNRDCMDCHMTKNSIQRKVHRRHFVHSHSIEARLNPGSCTSCHQMRECVQCHQNP